VPVIVQPPPAPVERTPPVPVEPAPPAPAVEKPAEPRPPDVTFPKVKLVVGQGDRTQEVDVSLMFLGDHMGVSPERGGATIRSVDYQDITKAVYEREERRRLFGRGTRHVLTIETSSGPIVLRLDKDIVDAVLRSFENHSRKPVER
jgi:hypothetical protein